MNKYTDLTLNSMKKANLIKYVRSLEEIIAKYDAALNKEYKAINEVIELLEHSSISLDDMHIYDTRNFNTYDLDKIINMLKGVDKECK